jgi:hypothetical protein
MEILLTELMIFCVLLQFSIRETDVLPLDPLNSRIPLFKPIRPCVPGVNGRLTLSRRGKEYAEFETSLVNRQVKRLYC